MLKRILSIILIAVFCLVSAACSRNTPVSNQKKSMRVSHSEMAPNLSYTLYCSDAVIRGTVLEKISEGHTNESGNELNVDGEPIGNAYIIRYKVRVEETFSGDPVPGSEIVVGAVNYRMIPYEYLNNSNVEFSTDAGLFTLEEGMEGVFCLNNNRALAKTEAEIGYTVVHDAHGVFTSEDGEHYVSAKGTEFDVSELPAVIEESKAKWDEEAKNTPEI